MRLIDADALHKRIKAKNTSNAMMRVMKAECLAEIDDAPTIEPERKKGKWIIRETAFEDVEATCSCCGFKTLVNEPGNGLHMVDDLNYCPNCGAYMKGESNED